MTIQHYLEMMAKVSGHSDFTFLLQHGRRYQAQPLPAEYPKGEPNTCLDSAFALAQQHGLIYVEGFALHIIPTHHAWAITPDGMVIDNVWVPENIGAIDYSKVEYFGIPFTPEAMYHKMWQTMTYGMLLANRQGKKRKQWYDKEYDLSDIASSDTLVSWECWTSI